MTVKELSQLYYLKREVEQDQRRLQELEAKLGVASPTLSGMPQGSGGNNSKVERYAIELAQLKDIIIDKQAQCIKEIARLEQYIAKIDDEIIRVIFTARYIECMSWKEIAEKIGGHNTDESVKKLCYRYLKKNPD